MRASEDKSVNGAKRSGNCTLRCRSVAGGPKLMTQSVCLLLTSLRVWLILADCRIALCMQNLIMRPATSGCNKLRYNHSLSLVPELWVARFVSLVVRDNPLNLNFSVVFF